VNVDQAVIYRIVALQTAAGARVYMLRLPQMPTTLPAVRVQLIDDPEEYHLRGGTVGRARVQVDCFAEEGSGVDPYQDASDLADEVNGDDAGSGMSGWIGSVGSPPTIEITGAFRLDRAASYDPDERRRVRMRMDFRVHYRRPSQGQEGSP